MKKTIIAASIAAVVAAPAAFADVSIYGKMHVSMVDDKEGDTMMENNASRLGFKATEDLGNGMKATAVYELGIDPTDGVQQSDTSGASAQSADQTHAVRQSFVAISGDFGQVSLGKQYAPTKVIMGAAEFAGDTIADITTLSGATETTATNALAYTTPSMNGVSAVIALVPSETNNASSADDTVDAAIMYSNGGLKVNVGMQDASANDKTVVSAQYAMGDFTVGAAFEDIDAGDESTAISVKYAMGANSIAVQYGKNKTNAGVSTDATGVVLTHSLSKSASVYLAATSTDTAHPGAANDSNTAIGVSYSF